MLIAVVPDSNSVVPGFTDKVVFRFDEAISERNLQGAVVVYPFERRPIIDKGKAELRVRSRNGWTADRIYHLRVEPVVQDLFNNRIEAPIQYIFSTGAELTSNRVQGQVWDRITGEVLRQGRVDMVRMPDTLRYGTLADSLGNFDIRTLPTGDFFAIGYEDSNNNARADDFDRADTARVSLGAGDTITLEFQVFRHDTLGPRIAVAKSVDSTVVELEFDGYIDPDFELARSMISLLTLPDSAAMSVDTVLHAWQYTSWQDSVAAVQRAIRDSLAAEQAAPADTARPPPDTAGQRPPELAPRAAGLPTGQRAGPPEAQQAEGDEGRPLPDRRIYVVAGSPIPPGEVVVIIRGLRNLTGLVGDSEIIYEQPAPPEPVEEEQPPEEEPPPGGRQGQPASQEAPFPGNGPAARVRGRHQAGRRWP